MLQVTKFINVGVRVTCLRGIYHNVPVEECPKETDLFEGQQKGYQLITSNFKYEAENTLEGAGFKALVLGKKGEWKFQTPVTKITKIMTWDHPSSVECNVNDEITFMVVFVQIELNI